MVVQCTNPLLQILGVLAVSNGLQETGEGWVRGSDEATPSPGHINSGKALTQGRKEVHSVQHIPAEHAQRHDVMAA